MFPPELWLHIAIGFIFGALSIAFITSISNQLKSDKSFSKLFNKLVLSSFLIACVSLVYAFAISDGVLQEWRLLGYPAIGDPAEKIVEVGYFQGESGKLYYDNGGNWEQVENVVLDPEKTFVPIETYSPNCGVFPLYPLLRDEFVEVQSTCMVWHGLEKVVYAIDYSGKVYVWSHTVPPEFNGSEIIFALKGGVISFIFGLLIIGILFLLIYLTGKMKSSSEETGAGE